MKDHDANIRLENDRRMLVAARQRGPVAEMATCCRLSGPGWLQSAMTLGAGSLGNSLYLGILGGFSLLWLQPLAMLLGVIMLGALSYVTLSTGQPPFRAINQHINPALGWLWMVAVLLANIVWSLPQFAMCFAAIEQNLAPALFVSGGVFDSHSSESTDLGKYLVSFAAFVICIVVTWSYGRGSVGIRIYESILKVVVALIVLSFMAVVFRMYFITGTGDWRDIAVGLIPKPSQWFEPTESFRPLLERITDPWAREYWRGLIVSQQRDVMISGAASAVGINMTYLLPSLLLDRRWDRDFRRLAIFDLSTGMFIPFVLATSCVVIASAQQFHTRLPSGFEFEGDRLVVPARFAGPYATLLTTRDAAQEARGGVDASYPTRAEQRLAAVLVRRDAFDLAQSLEQLFASSSTEPSSGRRFANLLFGVGVLGMTLSSISLMMLISGFVVCDMLRVDVSGWTFRAACTIGGFGMFWPLFWQGQARVWLTVVAGVFGAMLLPIAYVSFLILMNSKSLMGRDMLTGWKRWLCNFCMMVCVLAMLGAGVSAVMKMAGWFGLALAGGIVLLLLIGHFWQRWRSPPLGGEVNAACNQRE